MISFQGCSRSSTHLSMAHLQLIDKRIGVAFTSCSPWGQMFSYFHNNLLTVAATRVLQLPQLFFAWQVGGIGGGHKPRTDPLCQGWTELFACMSLSASDEGRNGKNV